LTGNVVIIISPSGEVKRYKADMIREALKKQLPFRRLSKGDLKPWMPTRRQLSGGRDAASQYGPLLSRQARLMGATRFESGANQVTVINDTPYARIHREFGY
jgi:hypothetical protein